MKHPRDFFDGKRSVGTVVAALAWVIYIAALAKAALQAHKLAISDAESAVRDALKPDGA